MMTKLTDLEKKMVKGILRDYARCGVSNTEFHNTFGVDEEENKKLRGAFASLKRKKIVSHYNDKGCFNPIYPTAKLVEACRDNGVEIPSRAMKSMEVYI